jgi:hypothetical protein
MRSDSYAALLAYITGQNAILAKLPTLGFENAALTVTCELLP